jgi:hypothetical protein
MADDEPMSDGESMPEGSYTERQRLYGDDLTEEEEEEGVDDDGSLDEEDDSDDVLEDMVDGLGPIMVDHGSDSDIEYGREGYFYPFDNDLILNGQHRDRYGTENSYQLSVPRTGHSNAWVHLFSAALTGKTECVQRELRRKLDFGDVESLNPHHRDFPIHCSAAGMQDLSNNIGHHLCDYKCAPLADRVGCRAPPPPLSGPTF